jgi:glycosyltransferase involved in cell wall biosynthesis
MRAKGISQRLGSDTYFLHYKFKRKIYGPIKYPILFVRSLKIMAREKPDTILCQVPPPFNPLSAIVYRTLYNRRATIVMDIHTAGLVKPWAYFRLVNKFIMKRSAAVIVTNIEAQKTVEKVYNIRPLVLEDKIPDIQKCFGAEKQEAKDTEKQFDTMVPRVKNHDENALSGVTGSSGNKASDIFVIAVPLSFSSDEPIDSILTAAMDLPDVRFYLTGDISRVKNEIVSTKPDNVTFTGFLKEEDYYLLLGRADGILCLTTRDQTMLSGSYEAVALERPLITSDWKPLRRYFTRGTIFVDNSPGGIRSAVEVLKKNYPDFRKEMHSLRIEKQKDWESKFTELTAEIGLRNN